MSKKNVWNIAFDKNHPMNLLPWERLIKTYPFMGAEEFWIDVKKYYDNRKGKVK